MSGGPATVKLANGATYVAERVELDAGALTVIRGALKVRDLAGERTYPARSFTIPIASVARIDWADAAADERPRLAAVA
jgi:hypothetical protein